MSRGRSALFPEIILEVEMKEDGTDKWLHFKESLKTIGSLAVQLHLSGFQDLEQSGTLLPGPYIRWDFGNYKGGTSYSILLQQATEILKS